MTEKRPASDILHEADVLAHRLSDAAARLASGETAGIEDQFAQSFTQLHDKLVDELFPAALELDDWSVPEEKSELLAAVSNRQIVKDQDSWDEIEAAHNQLSAADGAERASAVEAAVAPAQHLLDVEARARTWIASRLSTSFGA